MAFSIKDDWRSILWGPTLQVLLLRSIAAGIVWGTVIIFTGHRDPPGVAMPLLFPLLFMPFCLIMVGFGKFVSVLLGAFGLALIGQLIYGVYTLFAMACIMVGDPLVWLLHRQVPQAVPVEKFGFLNFCAILFVTTDAMRPPQGAH